MASRKRKRHAASAGVVDDRARPMTAAEKAEDAAFERAFLERVPAMTPLRFAMRVVPIVIVAIVTWRAIHWRGATALSLLMPFAGEMVMAIAVAPVLTLLVRDAKFRRESRSFVIWFGLAFAWLGWVALQASSRGVPVFAAIGAKFAALFQYVDSHGMTWACVAAMAGFVAAIVPDVIAYRRDGGPFMYIGSLSLGLRAMTMIVLGFWLMWAFDSDRRQRAEVLWFMLLAAEAVAIALPWLLRRRLAAGLGRVTHR